MARLVTYKCPDCEGQFDFLHHPSDEPPPDRCELCGSYMGDDPPKAPVLTLKIGTAKGKNPDRLVRQMEDASHERAVMAAEMTGASVADMSAMKITDLRPSKHEGDVAAPSPTKSMQNLSYGAAGRTVAPEMQNPHAAEWAAQTTSGDGALTTRRVIDGLQTSGRHNANIARLTAGGQMGKT